MRRAKLSHPSWAAAQCPRAGSRCCHSVSLSLWVGSSRCCCYCSARSDEARAWPSRVTVAQQPITMGHRTSDLDNRLIRSLSLGASDLRGPGRYHDANLITESERLGLRAWDSEPRTSEALAKQGYLSLIAVGMALGTASVNQGLIMCNHCPQIITNNHKLDHHYCDHLIITCNCWTMISMFICDYLIAILLSVCPLRLLVMCWFFVLSFYHFKIILYYL